MRASFQRSGGDQSLTRKGERPERLERPAGQGARPAGRLPEGDQSELMKAMSWFFWLVLRKM
jgi:hypothetical protein